MCCRRCVKSPGLAPPDDVDGISIVPTLTGEGEQVEHEGLYWEYARVSNGLTRGCENGSLEGGAVGSER